MRLRQQEKNTSAPPAQDRISHFGLDGILSHLLRYGTGDDASSADQAAAKDATLKFLQDWRKLLIANLGEAQATEETSAILTAASQLSPEAIKKYVEELADMVEGTIQHPRYDA